MILLVNCIANPVTHAAFDEHVVPRLSALADAPFQTVALDDDLPGPGDYSHLVLNGSELSASKENPRDVALIRTIRAFADAGRPILGICYGHQMIARAFGGECRRAAVPEFGWKAVDLQADPCFAGIPSPLVSAHSHFDEVSGVPDGFATIASTDRCAVQAMVGQGILGVQFHPELTYDRAEAMFAENLSSGAVAEADFSRDLRDAAAVSRNDLIFMNFFGAHS